MSDDSILVELDDVQHRFGHAEVLRGVSFQVRQGEVLGFLGPNGAGKSTTMNILTGALSPTAGTVRVCGFDLLREPLAVKRRLGYLPEIPPLYRDLTVDEYLRFCARLRGISRDALGRALEQAKRRTGLVKMSRRLIGQLRRRPRSLELRHEPRADVRADVRSGVTAEASAEERVLVGVEHGDLAGALRRLSPELRAVVQATVLDGLTTAEAGRLLGIPRGTVKTRMMRAKRELRAELA